MFAIPAHDVIGRGVAVAIERVCVRVPSIPVPQLIARLRRRNLTSGDKEVNKNENYSQQADSFWHGCLPLEKLLSGGGEWESNPPIATELRHTGFEDQESHQALSASTHGL